MSRSNTDPFIGDSGEGGTEGLVPAPPPGSGAAHWVCCADGIWRAQSGGGGTPASPNFSIQYNDNGSFGGIVGSTVDPTHGNIALAPTDDGLGTSALEITAIATGNALALFSNDQNSEITLNLTSASAVLNVEGGNGGTINLQCGDPDGSAQIQILDANGVTWQFYSNLGQELASDGAGSSASTTIASGIVTTVLTAASGAALSLSAGTGGNALALTGAGLNITASGGLSSAIVTIHGDSSGHDLLDLFANDNSGAIEFYVHGGTSSIGTSDNTSGAFINIEVDHTGKSQLQLGDGGSNTLTINPTHQTTVGSAGGASALPATPTGYLKIAVSGTNFVIPYYAAS